MKHSICLRLRVARDDSGAMLIMALIIITTVALVTGAMLSHSWTNFRATSSLKSVAGTSYAADAAAKLAINNLRLGSKAPEWTTPGFNGTWNDGAWNDWVFTNFSDGAGCFGATGDDARNTLAYAGVYPKSGTQTADPSARVECTPVPGTGILGGAGGVVIDDPNSTDPFAAALTTLGTSSDICGNSVSSSCSGVFLKVLGTGAGGAKNSAPIGGGVATKTDVTVDNGGIATAGFVRAVGSCNGTIISPDKQCGVAVPTPAVPASPLTDVPTVVTTMPTPSNPGKNCEFSPGTYISGTDLNEAMSKCTGVSHFASGKYYFDFLDDVPWTMRNTIIGGVRTGGTSVPGACQSPISFPNTAGVQFVFGGSSRVEVANGANVELCGPANTDGSAPMTIYQQQTNGSGTVVTPPPTTETFTIGPESAGTIANPSPLPNKSNEFKPQSGSGALAGSMLAASGDAQGAEWTSDKKGNDGELNLSAFADSIPSGATISAAAVRVDFATPPNFTPLPTWSLSGVPLNQIGSSSGTFDLTASQLTQLMAALPGSGSLAPTIKIKINGSGNNPPEASTFTIDKVALTVTYTTTTAEPPITVALRKTTPTLFISTKSNSTANFVVQGATYAPTGTIDVDAGQTAFIAFRWGLLANGVGFKTYPQQLFGYPLVSIPKPGSGLGTRVTVVDLEVFVCVDGGACDGATPANTGVQALTVRVMITDPPYANHPVAGVRRMKVLSWAEKH